MKLSEIRSALAQITEYNFILPNGQKVPPHFHVTEVGSINKHFIDCGGTIRKESAINFQLYSANDIDHRLSAKKLLSIVELSARKLELEDLQIEVEYQGDTIGKYGLEFDGQNFLLTTKHTDCLAKDNCGIPEGKGKLKMASIGTEEDNSCTPGSGCC
ncbi:MAG TPA: DUF6428 family protein [Fulvivirga sp.]|nr:DUF6428 family protein [Fulvivirga sp.]